MIHGRIEFSGKTLGDVRDAVEEAVSRIMNDMTTGHDRNEDSAFTFELDGEADALTDDHAGEALNSWQLQQLANRCAAQDEADFAAARSLVPTRKDDAPCPCGKSHTVAEHGYDPDA